ncbi:MAG: PKD domain-containing protein [bacterium]
MTAPPEVARVAAFGLDWGIREERRRAWAGGPRALVAAAGGKNTMRIMLAVLAALWTAPALAEVTLDSPNGTRFRIDDLGDGGLDGPAAFAGWPRLCVRIAGGAGDCAAAEIYDAAGAASGRELNNRQVVLAPDTLAGLTVRRKVFVPNAGQPLANAFVRYLDLLQNNTGAPITVSVRVGTAAQNSGRLGVDGLTVWRTRSDDAVLDAADRWLVVDDANEAGGAAAVGALVFGAGARATPARIGLGYPTAGDDQALAWDFDQVTIAPGATAAILTLVVHEAGRVAAIDEVDYLLRARDGDVLFGLTDDERRAIRNFDVDPQNGAALADAGGPYNAAEGEQVQLSASGSFDPEGQPLTYEWDFDGDGQYDDAVGPNAFHTLPDDGVYTIALRVRDAGGKVDLDTARIVVRNVAPRVDGVNTDSPIGEGQRLNVDVQVTDPGADALTFEFDWDGDGVYEELGVDQPRWDHLYRDDGIFNVGVRVRDDDGGVGESMFRVVVENIAPRIFNVAVPPQVAEGADFQILVTATDPGDDRVSYGYDLDADGVDDRAGEGLDRITTRFGDNGLFNVRVTVCDDQGACNQRVQAVNVGNRNPSIVRITDNGPVPEGSPITVTVEATDPAGPNDPLVYSFDWDNDGEFADDVQDQPPPAQQHVYRQQGFYFVGVRVRDDDNGLAIGNTRIEVVNVAPTAALVGPPAGLEGEALAFTCSGDDPGDDRLSYDWDLDGDGTFELLAAAAEQRPVFRQEGRYDVRCRVSDGDGGVDTASAEVIVSNARPTLVLEVASPQDEGAEVVVRAVATEPGDDTLTYRFDFDDDGVPEIDGATGAGAEIGRHVYRDQGLYTVRVVVDDGTDSIDATAVIDIRNVAPLVRLTSNTPVDEGQELVITAEVSDPGDDAVTLRWDLDGDGEYELEEPLGEAVIERAAIAADDADYEVTVMAIDEDGGETIVSVDVRVENVPPSFPAQFQLPPALEGQPYPGTVPANDPAGPADPLVFSLIDPPAGVEIQPVTGQILWVPDYDDYLDSPIELTVRVDDGDGGRAEVEISVDVLPRDDDGDLIPDSFEEQTCDPDEPAICLDPTDPADARDDPDGDGRDNLTEWMEGTDPFYFEGPDTPIPQAPVDGSRIATLTPALTVSWVENPVGDAVQIVFEVYADAALQTRVAESDPVDQSEEDGEPTSWEPPIGLLFEDAWYYWRARAVSGEATSEWSFASSFRTNATNQPPTAPVLVGPPDGASVDVRTPTFTAMPSVDLDEDEIRYIFNIYDVRTQNGVGTLRAGVVEFTPSGALSENATIEWEVVAVDSAGAETSSGRWSFQVDSENAAPTAPVFIDPAPPARPNQRPLVNSLTPAIVVGGAVDEDGDPVRYVVAVYDAAGELIEESAPIDADGDGQATWTPGAPLTENADHVLTAYALDPSDAASAITSLPVFVSAVDEPPPVPEPTSPADGVTIGADEAVMIWTEVDDPERQTPVGYVVEYCDIDGECFTAERERTSYGITELAEPGQRYTWRVKAVDPAGNESAWSAQRVFSIRRTAESVSSGCGCDATDRAPAPWTFALLLVGLIGLRRRR